MLSATRCVVEHYIGYLHKSHIRVQHNTTQEVTGIYNTVQIVCTTQHSLQVYTTLYQTYVQHKGIYNFNPNVCTTQHSTTGISTILYKMYVQQNTVQQVHVYTTLYAKCMYNTTLYNWYM